MRRILGLFSIILIAIISLSFPSPTRAAVIQVTNTLNSGAGSLRDAVTAANADDDFDVILFAIPGTGTHTITLTSQLPIITHPVEITAESEEGWVAATATTAAVLRVEIISIGTALRINGDDSIVRGLTIRGSGTGILVTGDRVRIEGCHIGVSLDGLTDQGNLQSGVRVSNSSNVIIGGTVPSDRNVLSGNGDYGVELSQTQFTSVIGNYIGTDATGLAPLQNDNEGVRVQDGVENYIGDDLEGGRNVIAGNSGHGVLIEGVAERMSVQNNYIGVKADGSGAVPAGASGRNNDAGIRVNSDAATGTTQIGGTSALARNVISGNRTGILISNGATRIEGNIIGLNPAGTAAVPNTLDGIAGGDDSVLIGGVTEPTRNIISGNTGDGIDLSAGTVDVFVQGNYIGTNAAGTVLIGNGGFGVNRLAGLIGGLDPGQGNLIAGNVLGGASVTSATTQVTRNRIYDNGGLGIDISPIGVRANVALSGQNYPIITAASANGSNLQVSGTLNSLPNTASIRVDFYASATCDPSGFGEGEVYLGETVLFTNASGNASFTNVNVDLPLTRRYITALAHRPLSNVQSEFSACFELPAQAGTINGSITLQGRGAAPNALYVVPLDVTVTPSGGGAPFYDQTVNTTASGGFTVNDVPPGTYTVRVKNPQMLSCLRTNVAIESGDNTVVMGQLRSGDANDDDVVNISDFSLLAASFGRASGAVGYDARADFNGDNVVTVADFSLLAASFGQVGGACVG